MRAILVENLTDYKISDKIKIEGESHQHLAKACRLKVDEEVSVLNGKGQCLKTKALSIGKRETLLEVIEYDQRKLAGPKFDLLLCPPKKDALDLSLKMATEIGFQKVYLFKSQFSQGFYKNKERMNSLLRSALIQSNALVLPEIIQIDEQTELQKNLNSYKEIYFFNSQSNLKKNDTRPCENSIMVIGPEGGFSESEYEFFKQFQQCREIFLPTNILRTPTALALASGLLIGAHGLDGLQQMCHH